MNDWKLGAATTIFAFVVFGLGWIFSASTIAYECKKIGVFYVGELIFQCNPKEAK
jgi:hypothetical protein